MKQAKQAEARRCLCACSVGFAKSGSYPNGENQRPIRHSTLIVFA